MKTNDLHHRDAGDTNAPANSRTPPDAGGRGTHGTDPLAQDSPEWTAWRRRERRRKIILLVAGVAALFVWAILSPLFIDDDPYLPATRLGVLAGAHRMVGVDVDVQLSPAGSCVHALDGHTTRDYILADWIDPCATNLRGPRRGPGVPHGLHREASSALWYRRDDVWAIFVLDDRGRVIQLMCVGCDCALAGPPESSDTAPEPAPDTGAQASLVHLEKGLALETAGRYEEASGAYRKAVETDSAYALDRLSLLAQLEDRDELDAVAAQFHDALPINASTARWHHEMAVALGEGRLDRAAGLYREAVDTSPAYAQALGLLWSGLGRRGVFDRVASVLNASLASDPGSPDAHRMLAAVYWTKGENEKAWREVHLCQQAGGTLDPGLCPRFS